VFSKLAKELKEFVHNYVVGKLIHVFLLIWFVICVYYPFISLFLAISLFSYNFYLQIAKVKAKKILLRQVNSGPIVILLLSLFFIYVGFEESKKGGPNIFQEQEKKIQQP
jgi:hypothetical protein